MKIGIRVLLYIMATLFVFLLGGYAVLQSSYIQTFLTKRVAAYFSSKLKTEISIGGVDVELFKKVILEEVCVKDLHSDTLLYVSRLKLDIGDFDLDSRNIFVDNVVLKDAIVRLKAYKDEEDFNYQFILDALKTSDTTKKDSVPVWQLAAGGMELDKVQFMYQTRPDTAKNPRAINFYDLLVNDVKGNFTDIKFSGDTIFFHLTNLSLREKSGFFLKEMSADMRLSSTQLLANSLKASTNQSRLLADIEFNYNSYEDYNDFINKVHMKATFNKSLIQMEDIAYFSEELYGMKRKTVLSGNVSGTVTDLKGRNIVLNIENETTYRGNVDLIGLPDIDKTYMSFEVKDLRTSKRGIEQIPLPPFNENKFIKLPANIGMFGAIKFKGNFSGYYYDFVSYGKFSTALGQIGTDISLKQDTSGTTFYKGKFIAKKFNLGKFLESEKYLGAISMNVNINGKDFSKQNAHLAIKGDVASIEAGKYNYQNINLNGEFARNVFNGHVLVDDENLNLDFNGSMDFSKSPTVMNFQASVGKARLAKLQLLKDTLVTNITGSVQANIVGDGINDAVGELILKEVYCEKDNTKYKFGDIALLSDTKRDVKTITLRSSLADAELKGKFSPLDVGHSFLDFFHRYFPVQTPAPVGHEKKVKKKIRSEEISFFFTMKHADPVTKVFFPEIEIPTQASCSGEFNSAKNIFKLNGMSSALAISGYRFKGINITSNSQDKQLDLNLTCKRIHFADSVWIDNLSLAMKGENDTARFKMNWKNSTLQKYQGDISGYIALSERKKTKVQFSPSQITIADTTWQLTSTQAIEIDTTGVDVKDLKFVSKQQQVKIFGKAAEGMENKLNLTMSAFSLSNFNPMLKGTGVKLSGIVSGATTISNLYSSPLLVSELKFTELLINKERIGDGNISSNYDSKNEVLSFNGNFIRDEIANMKFAGNYFPLKKENNLQASMVANSINLALFEPFTNDLVSGLKGTAGANLKITGTPAQPIIKGIIRADVDNVRVNYLGTDYHFNGLVNVEPNALDFADLTIYDANNNTARVLNGKMFHTNYTNFQLDVDIQATKCMLLNTTEKDNSLYYGKCYGSGIINIFGFLNQINISAALKSEKIKNTFGRNEYTQVFIPLTESGSSGENGFVTFVNKNATTVSVKPADYKLNTTGFTMDLKLEPTTDALMQVIFDEKVGDILKGTGHGNIEMAINEFGDFKMYGDYTIDEGDYLFTLKNIINKKFRLEKGGTVKWLGDPYQALININAIYELRTSLAPLFLDHEQTDATAKRYPVDLVMNLSNKLMQPDILFDVKLPTTDDFTRQKAYEKFKNSENDLNKQVFSLLVMNSFVPTDPSRNQQQTTGSPDAGTVTSTEMLSNQLSNWLSQISNEFDVGVHYRPGDYINRDQVELALSTQLFNDKLSIDGTVANNSNTTSQNTSNVVGDINAEYKLRDDGKLRAKAYNKTNESNILNTQKGPYTQGVGVFYREEFDTLGELYRRFLSKTKKTKSKK